MKQIYCDNHLLVLKKPAGISTQPDFHEKAKTYIKEKFGKPGNVFLHPLHRLDKPVSGLILFARTSKALARLNEMMRKKEIQKFYLAKVEGVIEEEGILEHCLLHLDYKAIVDPTGKPALLHYKRLNTDGKTSLVEIELKTGRYHQIRAQFSAIGHPVVGDQKYGAKSASSSIALFHHRLLFPHPVTRLGLKISAI